jgi:uncharacterized repeat protein (TIGR01451 family)
MNKQVNINKLFVLFQGMVCLLIACHAQSAIIYIGAASGANYALPQDKSAGTLSIPQPSGVVAGQALIASIAVRPINTTVTVPSGWTLMTSTKQTNGGVVTLPGGMEVFTYYHIAGLSEPSSYIWTFANTAGIGALYGGTVTGGILAFSGIDTSGGNPINTWSATLTSYSVSHATPSITPSIANTMLVSSISYLSAASFSSPTGPAGITERIDVSAPVTPNAVGSTLQLSTAPWPTATATGSVQATSTGDADNGIGQLMALTPSQIDPAISMVLDTPLSAGGTGSYTLTVINNGIAAEPGPITVVDTLPTGLTYVSSLGTGWSCSASGQVITCTRSGSLGAGATAAALKINVSVAAGLNGSITNTATVSGTGGDGNTHNNTAINTYTFLAVANFECLESGVTYSNLNSTPSARNPLYTKVAGTGFKFDVVALQNSGAISTTYTASSNVTVELFDDSASPRPACAAYSSPVASQAITFVAGDSGRKTLPLNFSITSAYRKLRCRVRDNNQSSVTYGCSSDDFAVRPSNFTVTATGSADADATGASTTNTPKIKAGANFSLTATANATGYNGTPIIDNTKISAHTGAAQAGTVSGSFGAANVSTAVATGAAFSYSEVGYFRFAANGVYDSTFTAIDSANGDCNTGFSASGSLNACSFGNNAATNYFGRFIPDHFNTVTTQACVSGNFTYSGQPFSTQVTAYNSSGGVTKNYDKTGNGSGGYIFAKTVTLSDANGVAGSLTNNTISASGFTQGVATATPTFTFTTPIAPATIKLRATDADSVTSSGATEGVISNLRSGRLFIPNTYGSELLPLTVPIEAQYWNGTAYQRNQQDSCSVVPVSSIALSNYKSNLAACETALSGGGTMSLGKVSTVLSKPGSGNSGSVDLTVNVGSTATGNYCTSASPPPPSTSALATAANIPWFSTKPSRATFGIYKTPVIYMRENFGPP